MTDTQKNAAGEAVEPDMSWIDIAVTHGREVLILGHSDGWKQFAMEHWWEDTFASSPPEHLEPGAYRWTGFDLGFWDEDERINATGGMFASLPTTEQSLTGEAVAYRYVHLDYAGRKVSRYGVHAERVNGHDPIEVHPLYATPQPAPVTGGASIAEEWCAYMDDAVSKAPEPLRKLGEYLSGVLDEDQWKTAERYLNAAALSPSAPEAPSERGVGDWHPRIGEEVRPSANMIERWPDWRDTRLWVVGVTLDRNVVGNPTRGLNVCVSDEWPVTNRTGGFTDGFYINRDHAPDDLVPLTRARKIGGAS